MELREQRAFSSFQKHRQEFEPKYPLSLNTNSRLGVKKEEFGAKEEIKALFKTL
jgi:hypothetical protein